jgi:hypothetical protein
MRDLVSYNRWVGIVFALTINIDHGEYANLDLISQKTNAYICGGFFLLGGILLIGFAKFEKYLAPQSTTSS